MCDPVQPRPSPRAFLTNLAGPRPWPEKIRLLLRNNWLKLVRMKSCCGHRGSRDADKVEPDGLGEAGDAGN